MKRGTFAIAGAMLLSLQTLMMAGVAQAASAAQERVVTPLNFQPSRSAKSSSSTVTRLNAFKGAPGRIANANVYDPQGKPVGAVQRIELRDGTPSRIQISLLGGDSMITLEASEFSYEPARNRVMSKSNAATLVRTSQTQ